MTDSTPPTVHELEFIANKRTCVHYEASSLTCKAGVVYADVEKQGPFLYRYANMPMGTENKPSQPAISKNATPCFEGADFGCALCPKRQWPKRKPAPLVFFGMPSYDERMHGDITVSMLQASKRPHPSWVFSRFNSSLLCYAFNRLWAEALAADCSWFLMVHADIAPVTPWWMDALLAELERTGADVLSVVSPIKDSRGLTSTGVDWSDMENPWRTRRLTMKEIMDLPITFSKHDTPWPERALLINTGMMLIDMRRDWVRRFPGFSIKDELTEIKCPKCFGSGCTKCGDRGWLKQVNVDSEDWNFSRWLDKAGCRVYATRAIALKHFGPSTFLNDRVWGSWQVDKSIPDLESGK